MMKNYFELGYTVVLCVVHKFPVIGRSVALINLNYG